MSAPRRPGGWLCAAWLAGLALACSPGEERASAPTQERYVSRLTPEGPEGRRWRPESQLPARPQASPWMVIYEVTRFPEAEATREQRRRAQDFAEACREAALRHGWHEYLKGRAAGYRPAIGDDTHYENREYILDDHILDPDRPEFLMYYETESGRKLAGVMFYVAKPLDEGPQLGGPETLWHYHVWSRPHCLEKGLIAAGVADGELRCRVGQPTHRSPEMLHVWFVDHPQGPFGTAMKLPRGLVEQLRWE